MKTLAVFAALAALVLGLGFGVKGKNDFDQYEKLRLELEGLTRECHWEKEYKNEYIGFGIERRVETGNSFLKCPNEQIQERIIELKDAYSDYKAENAKEMMVGGFAGAIAGPIAISIIYLLLMKIFRTTKTAVAVIKNHVVDVRDSAREAQVRKIVEKAALEEATRITTRAAMTVFDEKEIVALQKQINDALAKGDYETAQALMSTLRKIEGK